jgi:hypothetical protein
MRNSGLISATQFRANPALRDTRNSKLLILGFWIRSQAAPKINTSVEQVVSSLRSLLAQQDAQVVGGGGVAGVSGGPVPGQSLVELAAPSQ